MNGATAGHHPAQAPAQAPGYELLQLGAAGIKLAYQDVGDGPPVLLLHASAASHRQWRELVRQLAGRYRLLVPDLPGHGASSLAPDPARRTRTCAAAALEPLLSMLGGPLHLVGHSYGAAVAMKLALGWQERLLSLTLIEPAAFELLRQAGQPSAWEEIEAVATRQRALVRMGDLEGAADTFMGYWIGADAWAAMSAERRRTVIATMPGVADGWRDIVEERAPLASYGNLTVPTLLVRAAGTTRAAHRVVELLSQTLPNHRLVEIPGAGHMSPVTHPVPVNAAVAAHLNRETARAHARQQAVA